MTYPKRTFHPRCTISENWPKDNHVVVELTIKGDNLEFDESWAKTAAIVEVVWRTCIPARTNRSIWQRELNRWGAKLTGLKTIGPGKYVAVFQMTSSRPPRTDARGRTN